MKKSMGRKASAMICFVSLLLTVGMTGCANTPSENSGEQSSQAISSSEISERSDSKSQSSDSSETSDEKSQSSDSSKKSDEKSQSSDSSKKSDEKSRPSGWSETSDEKSQPSGWSETSDEKSRPSGWSETSDEKSQPSESSSEESGKAYAGNFTYSQDGYGNIILTKYNGRETAPDLPSVIDGKTVTAVGESCFAGNTCIQKIVLPDTITEIGDYAFECCSNLAEIVLSDSLRSIGEGVFSACRKINAVQLPENLEVIKKGAFLYCQSIQSIELPETVRKLGNFAFSNCSSLTSVTFRGGNVRELPDRLFYSCKKLTEINIPYTLDSIGKRTFSQCQSLTSISVPGLLDSVGDYAFESCSSLTKVLINALSVSETAYAGCYQLPEEMLPKPMTAAFMDQSDTGRGSGEITRSDTAGPAAGVGSLFDEDKFSGYQIITNDEFPQWSRKYLDFCNENGIPTSRDELFYTMLYKGEVIPHFMGMTSAENHDPAMSKEAASAFGDDYEETYLMMNHGLYTELKRGRMCDDLVLYSGVYDSQLMAAAGTSQAPTLDQLKDCIGNTFTDPIMISTTTDIGVACGFSDTLFIIYASKESMDRLGAVSIDSIIGTNEKEILMAKNATYRILEVGTMAVKTTDSYNNETEINRNYIKVELL